MSRMTADEFVSIHGPEIREIMGDDYTDAMCRDLGKEVEHGTRAKQVIGDLRHGRQRLAREAREAQEARQAEAERQAAD